MESVQRFGKVIQLPFDICYKEVQKEMKLNPSRSIGIGIAGSFMEFGTAYILYDTKVPYLPCTIGESIMIITVVPTVAAIVAKCLGKCITNGQQLKELEGIKEV